VAASIGTLATLDDIALLRLRKTEADQNSALLKNQRELVGGATANAVQKGAAFLAIVADDVVIGGLRRIGKRSPDVLLEFIEIHRVQSPNEK
jgi:hypothetical protein